MKYYIYRKFLSQSFLGFYQQMMDQNSFVPHYYWFNSLLDYFSRNETQSPEEADFFVVPIFLIPFQFYKLNIDHWIDDCEYLDAGRHILFASGDFGIRKKSVYEAHHPGRAYPSVYSWLDERFTIVALESTGDLLSSDVSIFPFQSDEGKYTSDGQSRDLLYSFSGAMRYELLPEDHVRNSMKKIAGSGPDWFVGPTNDYLSFSKPIYTTDVSIFHRSKFTLCPAGFGRWTFRYIESLLAGSIPVILSDGYVMPFSNRIDWKSLAIVYPEVDLEKLPEFLRSIKDEKIQEFQYQIQFNRYKFTELGCIFFLDLALRDISNSRRLT